MTVTQFFRLLCIVTIILLTAGSMAKDDTFPPAKYLSSKLQKNDIVFLGTRHKQPLILKFIARVIPSLIGIGVTHIGLEIPSDQQANIDVYMKTGNELPDIQLQPLIDCPEYRNLFTVIRNLGGPVPVAIDLPKSRYQNNISRDEWMAGSILELFQETPKAKVLVVVGNLHTLKKLDWEKHVPDKHLSIREYIHQQRPSTRMWSVGQLIGEDSAQCDFTRTYGPLPHAVALDLDDRHLGWKMGIADPIAIVPAQCFELLDGVIVY